MSRTNPPDTELGSENAVPSPASAAAVRRTIVQVLADGEKTPDQVQHAAADLLGPATRVSIVAQLRVLRDGNYITAADADARQVQLTEAGERWLTGIRALSGRRG